jgi:hypothetical protein
MKYIICIYQPNVDPGGFQKDFIVETDTYNNACQMALNQACEEYDHGSELAVSHECSGEA